MLLLVSERIRLLLLVSERIRSFDMSLDSAHPHLASVNSYHSSSSSCHKLLCESHNPSLHFLFICRTIIHIPLTRPSSSSNTLHPSHPLHYPLTPSACAFITDSSNHHLLHSPSTPHSTSPSYSPLALHHPLLQSSPSACIPVPSLNLVLHPLRPSDSTLHYTCSIFHQHPHQL